MESKRIVCCLLSVVMLMAGCISTSPPVPKPAPAPAAPVTSANGTTVNVSTPTQPCCPHQTLWQFLGVTGGVHLLGGIIERIRNRLGSIFPGLESTPPLVAITDPSMAASSNPAEAAAAGAKADEDAAPQKIKAIRYLATLGCAGCYPGIEDALLESLDDCTEAVRYEAAKALRELSGKPCALCKTKSCCSPKVLKKLDEVVNKMEKGCYKESSARVRREARLAMQGCGGTPPAPTTTPQEGPSEGPAGAPKSLTAANGNNGGSRTTDAGSDGTVTAEPVSTRLARQRAAAQNAAAAATPATDSDCGCEQPQSVVVQTSPAAKQAVAKSAGPSTVESPTPAAAKTNFEGPPAARTARSHSVSVIRSSGAVLAEVNGELIFESDVLPEVDRQLANLGAGISVDEKLRMRPTYLRRELARVIDRKLLCQEARRSSSAVTQASFEEGRSDEAEILAAWGKDHLRIDETVTEEQLWACYQANPTKFVRPAEVRYEELWAPIAEYPSRDEAKAAIEYVRNRAMGMSQPPMAASRLKAVEAKTFDWTSRDRFASSKLARTLFTQSIGAVSEVTEDANGYRVLRVLERHAAGLAPFELVVEAVRQQVLKERRDYMQESYLRPLRSRAKIWTAFDSHAAKGGGQRILPLAD